MIHPRLYLVAVSSLVSGTTASISRSNTQTHAPRCRDLNGTFSVPVYQLYPENGDWDTFHCKLYTSAQFNASIWSYDPYTGEQEYITFEEYGITGAEYHADGVDWGQQTASMYVTVSSAMDFYSNGTNLTSGPAVVIRYDTKIDKVGYVADLAAYKETVFNATGLPIGGFQDQAEDIQGNCYTVPSYGVKSVAKISPDGLVSDWYVDDTATAYAPGTMLYNGLVWDSKTNKLIVTDVEAAEFVTYDAFPHATFGTPTPVAVVNKPESYIMLTCDGLINPLRYGGDVLLCSEDVLNAITIFRTTDGWVSAEYIGQVENNDPLAAGGYPVATTQMADRIFIVNNFLSDNAGAWDEPGDRNSFPFIDITEQVDAIVTQAGITIITQ